MNSNKKIILKVLVGSRAHGLAEKNSDYDYRAVYVTPTSHILALGHSYKASSFVEGDQDNTSYEIGHFLKLATHCNPSILEVFKAPIINATKDGIALRKLFPYIWTPKRAFDAFVGYGLNQRKKMFNPPECKGGRERRNKYAVAYIRVLCQLIDLLKKKDFDVEVSFLKEEMQNFKHTKNLNLGKVINTTETLVRMAKDRLEECKHEPDLNKVNEFLIDIRKRYW